MNRVVIIFLFVVAIAVSVVTNAVTATSAPTDPAATVGKCANCPQKQMDCATCPKKATCDCANCPGPKDCPQMKGAQGEIKCANCPQKDCPNKECPQQAATVPCDKCPKKGGN